MQFTSGQRQRIRELDIFGEYGELLEGNFNSLEEREKKFKDLENELADKNQEQLKELTGQKFKSDVRIYEDKLRKILNQENFTEVMTPIRLARGKLERMGITSGDPLWQQIYWLQGGDYCLRPMHAPNLYEILSRFEKNLEKPVRIFEVGSCFRKESSGSQHLSEFTMLNLVELGPVNEPISRLEEIVELIMDGMEIDYQMIGEKSSVYGETVDVMVNDIEIGSGAVGPHELDKAWDIKDSWAGIGIGLERLIMAHKGIASISRVGRSLIYQDGARLNI